MEKTLNNELFSNKNEHCRNIRLVLPYPITHRFKVDADFVGESILEMMSTKFPFHSRQVWKTRIETGRVLINESKKPPGFTLSASDKISHHNPSVIEPSVPDEIEVLEEHEDYFIVYKPAPMPMHPGGRYNKNTLTEILKENGYDELRITHRLDAVTSGIVLIARTKAFAKQAVDSFTKGRVVKTYFAEVKGTPDEKSITITAPIRRKNGFVFECGETLEGSKTAITHFEEVEKREGSSIIKCIPETGRTHQIRLHLAQWGYPIIDDLIYRKDGDQSGKTTQNRAISLLNAGIEIEDLGIDFKLNSNFRF